MDRRSSSTVSTPRRCTAAVLHHLSLLALWTRLSVQDSAAYRADFFVNVLLALLHFAAELVGLWTIFSNTTSLGEWNVYQILALLGAGGMGEVYRACDARLGRDVALKVIPAELARDPERIKRFEQEARAAGALNHPNVCAILDIGTHEGAPFVVMELLEGESLRARFDAGPIPVRKVVDWAAQAAHGLAAAHEKGIVIPDDPADLVLF